MFFFERILEHSTEMARGELVTNDPKHRSMHNNQQMMAFKR